MALSTNLISGLVSGLDWRTMIDQLIEIEHRRVDLVEDQKTEYESKLSEWQSFNTKLLALKTAAEGLKDPDNFYLYTAGISSNSSTVQASSLLSVSTTTSASPGTYNIEITELAKAQKLSSKGFSAYDTDLNLSGEFVINGQAISVATADDLMSIRDKINNLNTGTTATEVTATILSVGSADHRLILTSDATGKAGIDLKDASADSSNLVQALGFTYSSAATKTIKNVMGTDVQRSDYFTSRSSAIDTLLGLTSAQNSNEIIVGDKDIIDIDLADDSLDAIKAAIDLTAPSGVTTSVVETTIDGQTMYYLKIEGTTTFSDKNNILETIGILKTDFEEVSTEVLTADQVNTASSTAIDKDTLWSAIDDAGVTANDTITISGTDHNGNAVSGSLKIDDTGHKVDELLDAIESTFGLAADSASIIDGKIRVTDNTIGDSQLTVILTENNQGGGALNFGNITTTTANVGNVRNTEIISTDAIDKDTQWDDIVGASVTNNDTITISGTDHNGNAVSGTLTIDDNTHTVQELLTAIQTTYSNTVTASITSEGKIQVLDDTSGTSYLTLTLTENNEDGGSLDFGVIEVTHGGSDREMVAGNDATLRVDGLQVTSTDNTVEDVIAGVTLNLLKADTDTTITLNIDHDIDTIKANIQDLVDKYNNVMSYINTQFSYDEDEEKTGGVLFADGTLRSVKSDLTSVLTQQILGVDSDFSYLSQIGIANKQNEDDDWELDINDATLTEYLEANFNDIRDLFAANGTANVGTLEYIYHSRDTEPNEDYDVYITDAALQSTLTSIDGGVGTDGTLLTITEGGKTARISLDIADSLAQIVSAINTELDTVYTENLVGSEALTAGGAITSSTIWSAIDGTSWGGVVEKVISFSGTTRSGQSVQGSYEDFNATIDTVQDLLTEIEDEFSNEVTASIDSSGRIVLTDKYAGNSQLSLDITEPSGSGLDFGAVDVTIGEGDGSQEGRYAIPITASDSGSNELVLTHDSYGSANSFTVQESQGNGLWNTTDETNAVPGEDVAGTIEGKAATGSGQVLTGDTGDVEGLVIKYTGTDVDQKVGEIKLTIGVAELFERVLYNMLELIDNGAGEYVDGYVTFKQDSIQDRVNELEDDIDDMNARLNRKMEMMINRFVAMELALSKIQNQSDWLAGQISASFSGWL